MLIAQDLIWFTLDADYAGLNLVYLPRLTLDCQGGWDLRFFENSDLFELSSFSPKIFLKLLSSARPFFHPAFFFQLRKHISDAMYECHVMYDFV